MNTKIFKIAQSSPDDISGIETLIQKKQIDPRNIIAVMGKTENNGCVNDFTRDFATQTLKKLFC